MSKSEDIPADDLPQHLGHKPVYSMPYQQSDGHHSTTTDCRYFSVGLAQWGRNEASVKIMRHTGNRWTRQAEEIPLHRALDMTLFLAHVLGQSEDEVVRIKPGEFEHQGKALAVQADPNRSAEEKDEFRDYLNQHDALLKRRLNALRDALNNLHEEGKF